MLLFLSVLLFLIAVFPYMIYLWGIYFGRKSDRDHSTSEISRYKHSNLGL